MIIRDIRNDDKCILSVGEEDMIIREFLQEYSWNIMNNTELKFV